MKSINTIKNTIKHHQSTITKIIMVVVVIGSAFAVHHVMAADIPAAPNPAKLVNDNAGMLSAEQISTLEKKLRAYNDSTTNQIVIVTVPSIGMYAIDDYANRLANQWGIGVSGKDNGILVLVAKGEKQIDIEVGTRMDASVTDIDAKRVIDQQMVPAFSKKDYYGGLTAAVDKLIATITAHPL